MTRTFTATDGKDDGPRGFEAFGRRYRSERAAIVSFVDKVRAGEKYGGDAFAAWAEVCRTDELRTGLRMIAERESYHARVFQRRLAELGGEERATTTEEGRKLCEVLGSREISDGEKLLYFARRIGRPEDAIKAVCDFAERIRDDRDTKEALRLFAEDELSTTRWLEERCTELASPRGEPG